MNDDILDYNLHNINDDLRPVHYAGFWVRVGASLIDALILLPVMLIGIYNSTSIKSIALMLLISLLSVLYKPLLEWKKSATLGKMALNLKVVTQNLDDLTLSHSLKRNSPWILTSLFTAITNVILYSSPSFIEATSWFEVSAATQAHSMSQFSSLFGLIFIVIVIPIIFDDRKQGLHDLLAHTYCIRN